MIKRVDKPVYYSDITCKVYDTQDEAVRAERDLRELRTKELNENLENSWYYNPKFPDMPDIAKAAAIMKSLHQEFLRQMRPDTFNRRVAVRETPSPVADTYTWYHSRLSYKGGIIVTPLHMWHARNDYDAKLIREYMHAMYPEKYEMLAAYENFRGYPIFAGSDHANGMVIVDEVLDGVSQLCLGYMVCRHMNISLDEYVDILTQLRPFDAKPE